jgi:hypothetical protein
MTNTATRDLLIGSVRKYAADGLNNVPLSDWYETTNGQSVGFRARYESSLPWKVVYTDNLSGPSWVVTLPFSLSISVKGILLLST